MSAARRVTPQTSDQMIAALAASVAGAEGVRAKPIRTVVEWDEVCCLVCGALSMFAPGVLASTGMTRDRYVCVTCVRESPGAARRVIAGRAARPVPPEPVVQWRGTPR